MFFESFIFFIISFLFGASTLVIGARNPIHSILILILVFFLGSILLFLLSMEYFAILFLIVYVGAIVVLFLFIVMMLEIKMVNSSERFSDLFSFKNIILGFLVLEILFFSNEEFWDITPVFQTDTKFNWNITEINLHTDYSKVLHYIGQLKAIGGILFSHYLIAIILISILLFISMFGSIVMTLESTKRIIIKQQDATLQGFRNPLNKAIGVTETAYLALSASAGAGPSWGIRAFMEQHPIASGVVIVTLSIAVIVWGGPIVAPYVAPFVPQALGGLFGGGIGALNAGATHIPTPPDLGKAVEHISTTLAPDSGLVANLAEAATTAVAGVLVHTAIRLVDGSTQTEEAEVPPAVSAAVQTEVLPVIDGVAQTDPVPIIDGVSQTEVTSVSSVVSQTEEPVISAIEHSRAIQRFVDAHKEHQLMETALFNAFKGAKESKEKITELEGLLHGLAARSADAMRDLLNLITGDSTGVSSKAIIERSVNMTLDTLSRMLDERGNVSASVRNDLIMQARGSATRSARNALDLLRESNSLDADAVIASYNEWFTKKDGAATEQIAMSARAVGPLAGKTDIAVAQPALGFYAELEAPAAGGAGGPAPAPLRGRALNNFLSESHYRNDSQVPEEVHAKMHAAFKSILDYVLSVKRAKAQDVSSIESLSSSDAEAIEETIREVFMIIMYHFY